MGTGPRRAPATLALIVANLGAYALEVLWWSQTLPRSWDLTLYRLGALVPDAVLEDGAWWRAGTALFLHANLVHLGANMVALLAIGADLEAAIGTARFLAVYVLAGLGSMLGLVALVAAGWGQPEMVVGASGAIMGLVGALGALALAAWLRHRSGRARSQVARIALVVALQSAFDIATPQVSMAAHLGGLAAGLVVGALLLPRPAAGERR